MHSLNLTYLSTALSPHLVIYKETIDSTNQYLLDHFSHLSKGTLCIANQQTAGRGRRGRHWQSPKGSQIIMSLYWTLPLQKSIEGLSLVVGLAIADCLHRQGAKIRLKWPNDILVEGRKLGGILVEIAKSTKQQLNLVIGVGINISLPKDNNIDQPWANLNEILKIDDINPLIVQLYYSIMNYLDYFAQNGIDHYLQQQWQQFDGYFGQTVQIIAEQHCIEGINKGIDNKGYLLLATAQEQLKFNAGEVSLRKSK